MTDHERIDIGFMITKPPTESGLVETTLQQAVGAFKAGRSIELFLLSDGVWLAMKGQSNNAGSLFEELASNGAIVTASEEHLMASGISADEMVEGVQISRNPYRDLVERSMEIWTRTVSL